MAGLNQRFPTLTLHTDADDVPSLAGVTLVPGALLGEGGMGRVLAAQELLLDRCVAIKTARDPSPDHEACLLREARVLAQLEHPNILPVYGVASIDGRTAIILKRIHGRQWSESMDEATVQANISVLLRVMDAVAFAHSRGFLHRDLKPSNVMVGEFGEVYLMDWGLALPIRESPAVFCASGSLPYMAPEMLHPQEQALSEKTDVYLLGAILYQIISGQPPHVADCRAETLASIERSQPAFGQGRDVELVAICQRALRRLPESRFPTVDSFAQALREYLGHDNSRSLVRRAQGMVALLEQALAAESEIDRQDVYELFGTLRFAFQEALRGWPENREARSGLLRSSEIVARYELDQGATATALNLLAEVGVNDGPLVDRAHAQMQSRAIAESEARQLRRQGDANISLDSRRRTIVALGVGWTLLPLLLEGIGSTHALLALCNGAFLLVWVALGLLGRHWVQSTMINRQTYGLVLAGSLVLFIATLGLSHAGMRIEQTHVLMSLHFFGVATAFVFLVEWRIWPAALGLFTAFILGSHLPDASLMLLSASNAILAVNATIIGQEREPLQASSSQSRGAQS